MQTKFTRLEDSLPEKSHGSIVREKNGQLLLLNKSRETAVKIDELSREIWELCDGVNSVSKIASLLAVRYSTSAEEILPDIGEVISHLEKSALLQLTGREILDSEDFRRLDLRGIKFYVINCTDDVNRKEFMQKQLEKLGLNFEFISGVKCDPHPVGIALSHLKILRRDDLEVPFAILEDDCQFTEEFSYTYELPSNTDAFYLGISHFGLENPGEFSWGQWGKVRHSQYTKEFLRVYNMFALHAVVYCSEKFRQNAIIASLNALTSRDYTYPSDIEFAMLHDTHLVLTPNEPACYQSEQHRGNHVATRSSLRTPAYMKPDMHAPNDMEVVNKDNKNFYLFVDIFVHWTGKKISAVAPYYDQDIDWNAHGVNFEQVVLFFGPFSITGQYIPYRLDSLEPCILFDFEHPMLESYIRTNPVLEVEVRAGPYRKEFQLSTEPQKPFDTAMSLVIRDENRWVKNYLDYYLSCMLVEHIYVYDNYTEDKHALLEILSPYIKDEKVTYIPWNYRWLNDSPHKQIGQPTQEVQCLNKYGATRWIGFFDIDEFLRIPGQTVPQFLQQYDATKIGGVSFGLRWFMYQGDANYSELGNPLLECLYSKKDELGRNRQKLFVSPYKVRFMRFHWIEEGQHEEQVSDEEIYFHHYYLTEERFNRGKQEAELAYDDYMLQFAGQLSSGENEKRQVPTVTPLPKDLQGWIDHVEHAFDLAEQGISKLDREILRLEGMSGTFTRHFYNNICNLDSCRYLEVGCWKGASLSAALFGNKITAVAIDDWSEFNWTGHGDPREVFYHNVDRFIGESNLKVLEEECFSVDIQKLGKVDIYMYDGSHSEQSQFKAIEYFYPCLADYAVIIIDDWNFPQVRRGTMNALESPEINVVYQKEIILPDEEVAGMPQHQGRFGWWNGICILIISKQA